MTNLNLGVSIKVAVLLLISFQSRIYAQTLVLKDSIKVEKGKELIVDNLGNLYILSRDNSLNLYSINGGHFMHNEKSLGKIANVDVSNPLRILLHYSDANTIMFLDNTLSLQGVVKLDKFGIYGQNILIANSKLGGFWVFNPIEQSISRYDAKGTQYAGSQLVNMGNDFEPKHICEKNGKVFIVSKTGILYEFDLNGVFSKKYPARLKIKSNFQVEDNSVFWAFRDTLYILNTQSLTQNKLPLPRQKVSKQSIKLVTTANRKCYILKDDQVLIYLIK